MFNVEQAIAEWRRQMLSAGIKTPVPLAELESHLREDMERELRNGLNAQQAFEAAVGRMGPAKALEAEFAKVPEPKETRERKLKLLCLVFVTLAYLTPFALNWPQPWNHLNPTEQWLGLTAFALAVVGPFSGLLLHRWLPVIRDQRIRSRVQFASALPLCVWLCVFVFGIVPRVEWTFTQMSVATLWAWCPLAVFGGLICGLDEAARRGAPAASA